MPRVAQPLAAGDTSVLHANLLAGTDVFDGTIDRDRGFRESRGDELDFSWIRNHVAGSIRVSFSASLLPVFRCRGQQ
jgi:hypothetical protein